MPARSRSSLAVVFVLVMAGACLIPHNSLCNYARMQEVWLDK
jgi:hypothetical protein